MAIYVTVHNDPSSPDYGMQTRVSLSTMEPRANEVLLTIEEFDTIPSSAAYRWNRVTREYEAIPAPPTTRFIGSKLEFSKKIGFTRESHLHQLIDHASVPAPLKGDLRTMVQWLGRAGEVNLTDPDTIAQTQQLAALYSNATLMGLIGVTPLTEQEATDYVAAALTPWSLG